jgi:hypothetical protein
MAYKVWEPVLDGTTHKVELEHGEITGNRTIRVDGELLEKSNKWFDTGTDHEFQIGGHTAVVSVVLPKIISMHHEYQLTVDGEEVTAGSAT